MNRAVDGIAGERGWGDDTLLVLAERFIEQEGLAAKFLDYLREVAAEEDVMDGLRAKVDALLAPDLGGEG